MVSPSETARGELAWAVMAFSYGWRLDGIGGRSRVARGFLGVELEQDRPAALDIRADARAFARSDRLELVMHQLDVRRVDAGRGEADFEFRGELQVVDIGPIVRPPAHHEAVRRLPGEDRADDEFDAVGVGFEPMAAEAALQFDLAQRRLA